VRSGESGRHGGVGGALGGDGEVVRWWCDTIEVRWPVELGAPVLRSWLITETAWGV
jgi:hypothetical protein